MDITVVLKCTLPAGVSAARFRDYVIDEVRANIGHLSPDDPLFDLDRDSVSAVTLARKGRPRPQ